MIAINQSFRSKQTSEDPPQFEPGQLVRHRRYGYRGVVVAFDLSCQADPTWYMSNKTQPDRQQPWYHVLVHGTSTCTYAAQENLRVDEGSEPVDHPLLGYFFSGFENGRHIRNDVDWPA